MFLDGDGEIGSAFDRGIVGHDKHFPSVDCADARDHTGGGSFIIIHAVRG